MDTAVPHERRIVVGVDGSSPSKHAPCPVVVVRGDQA